MMELIRSYILTVFAASMVCAITVRLTGGKMPAIRVIASLFLTFCVLRPIVGTDISSLISSVPESFLSVSSDASDWEAEGRQALRDGIQERTEAYILMEAKSLGVQIDVEVSLTEDDLPVPASVTIHGDLSPYQKTKLSHTLTSDLGIRKEAVTWT